MAAPDFVTEQLRAVTVPIDDPGPLTSLLPTSDAYAFLRHGDGLIAWGEVVRYKPMNIAEADEWWTELCEAAVIECQLPDAPAGASLLAFGSFVFDPDNTAAQSAVVVPRVVVGRRQGHSWLTRIGEGLDEEPTLIAEAAPASPGQVAYADGGLSGPQWESAVAEAVRRIRAGRLDKVVLARDLLASTQDEIDPRWLVGRLASDYAKCWTYAIDGFVGATPEMLIRREDGLATSRVLAGTIRRSGDDDHDLALAAALEESSKDLAEHEYAVRSVARALMPYCSGMNVPDAPYLLELPNVWHLATDVTAACRPGASSLALASALHPSAAVCGTPTEVARRTIAELEHLDRERYSGPVGWIDARGDGEWAIALRCGQISQTDPRQMRLFAGCGIVAGSDPEAEFAEAGAKLVPMRDALGA